MQFAVKTDIGKLRDRNEDSHYFHPQLQLFAIADGLGGHERGNTASRIAVEVIQEWAETGAFSQNTLGPREQLDVLSKLVEEANQRIYTSTENQVKGRSMGTTLIASFVTLSYLVYAHVGDSRLYVLRHEKLTQITTDHSLVEKMIEKGEITPEEGRVHKKRNIITQAIGLKSSVSVETNIYPLISGDTVLACTDGLYNLITDNDEIVDIILSASGIEEAAEHLISKVLDYGGTDNVTVLLVNVD